jgi:hypothetical protein
MSSPKPLVLTAVAALIVLGAASHAQAQTIVKCTVPFEFSLGGLSYPGGDYTLTTAPGDRSMLTVRNWTADVARFILVQPEARDFGSDTRLTFNRYGDRYFLASVVIGGDGISLRVPRSAAEREMASRLTREEVTLLASNR